MNPHGDEWITEALESNYEFRCNQFYDEARELDDDELNDTYFADDEVLA